MIRAAVAGDAEAIARLELRAWWRSHSEWLDPGSFASAEERIARWRTYLDEPAIERTTLVCEVAGRVAGVVSFGRAREAPAFGELLTLSVDPPAQGAGVGGGLLAEAQRRLSRSGWTEALLWVFVANVHARHVYELHGWVSDLDSRRDGPGAAEIRYRRTL